MRDSSACRGDHEWEATTMRKLISAMKISVDGKYEGPHGYADWVAGDSPFGRTAQAEQLPDGRLRLVYGIGSD